MPTETTKLAPEYWRVEDIACHLNLKPATVRECVVSVVGFPKPIRLPVKLTNGKIGSGRRMWPASEIRNYLNEHREEA